jgi:putative transposase
MREDNLLCLRRRKSVVTTNSGHGNRVYPNIAGDMRLTVINQLWVADITYIRLDTEFVYLAVILDAFSRRVIGWALDRTPRSRTSDRGPARGIETTSAACRPLNSIRM